MPRFAKGSDDLPCIKKLFLTACVKKHHFMPESNNRPNGCSLFQVTVRDQEPISQRAVISQ
jgi:hypothetical protein